MIGSVTIVLLIGIAAWALPRLWRVLAIGASYKAKVMAMTIFGTGRSIDSGAEEVSADSYWLMRAFRTRVDHQSRTVTASLFGIGPRTATFSDTAPAIARGIDWPAGHASVQLGRVVDLSFTEPNPARLRRTRAVLILRDGELIAERYAPGFGPDSRFAAWSVTKAVLGSLVGILIGDGRLRLDQRELMPAWRSPDPRAAISLEDLLRMRSGLQFSEIYDDLASDVVQMLFNSRDVVAYAASRPLNGKPGTLWSYSSGTTNILSGIVRRVVGESEYLEWPRRVLFDPLGMESAVMDVDAAGNFVCSSFMVATARDWARFGQLQLSDGDWNGRRILPAGWVRFCTTPTPQSPANNYGAHWWLKLQPEIGGGTAAAARIPPDAFFAIGHEGQTLTIIPSRQLVIVRLGLSIYIDAWNHAQFVADVVEAL